MLQLSAERRRFRPILSIIKGNVRSRDGFNLLRADRIMGSGKGKRGGAAALVNDR